MKEPSSMSIEFFNAIKQGKLEEVKKILAATPQLIHEKDNGASPLLVAVYHQEPEIAEFLADQAGTLNIFEACALGRINMVMQHLARDVELVNAYAEDGFQPLGLASFFGHYEIAEYLIKAGAAINSQSKNPLSAAPIQSAAAAGHVKIVMLLLNHNANPNVREQNGYTPLHAAAQNGDMQMLRSLLFNGADMSIRSTDGKLALDLALEAGQTDAAALLKEGITRRFKAARPKL
jgi:ankyrin repeat protein